MGTRPHRTVDLHSPELPSTVHLQHPLPYNNLTTTTIMMLINVQNYQEPSAQA
jgi:hypothetical protein